MLDSEGGLVRSGHPGSLQGEPWVGGGKGRGREAGSVHSTEVRHPVLFVSIK